MAESREMSVDEAIAELEKPPEESRIDLEKLLAHLYALSWFRNRTGEKARAYLALPNERLLKILTMEEFLRWLRAGQVSRQESLS